MILSYLSYSWQYLNGGNVLIGKYRLNGRLILAPMAGVTDQPFRKLCRRMGAALVVGEMVSANPKLRNTRKTQLRMNHDGECEPIVVQIAGGDAASLAEAAKFNVDCGAQIIDINMGCPAKKVCNKAAGSALLRDERLVDEIVNAVVNAVDVPVTLKIRLGWDRDFINANRIAKIAENAGIQALAVHGRTRCEFYEGFATYDEIADIKSRISIPVIANGDIDSAQKAKFVLDYTGADALMIGRAAQGRPWIFNEINQFLQNGAVSDDMPRRAVSKILISHMRELYSFYGEFLGLRIARKHVAWYCKTQADHLQFRREFNVIDNCDYQLQMVEDYLKS
jgi:tRNA-dihydrouridine synthase B